MMIVNGSSTLSLLLLENNKLLILADNTFRVGGFVVCLIYKCEFENIKYLWPTNDIN